jgi:hypothetical protein
MTWEKSLTKLQVWMEESNTMPELHNAIIKQRREWNGLTRRYPMWTTNHGLRAAVLHQDELG